MRPLDSETRYLAPHDIPGFCSRGDLFIELKSGEVVHASTLNRGARARFILHRSSLENLDPPSYRHPFEDSRPDLHLVTTED